MRLPALADEPMVRALAALRPDPWRCVLAVAAGVGALGSAIALLGVSGWLITRASQQPPVLYLMVAVVTVRALGLGRGVLRYAERLAGHDVALRGAVTLRATLFERLCAAPPAVVARYRRGDLLTRLGTDVDDLADVVVRALLPFAVAAVTGLAAVLAVGLALPAAGAALLAGLLLAGVAAPLLAARAAARAEQGAAQAEAAVTAELLDLVENVAELTVAGVVPDRLARGARLERTLAHERDGAARPAAAAAVVAALGTGGAVLAALALGVDALAAGRLDATLLAVVVLVALGAGETVAALPAAAVTLVRARHAGRRIGALLDAAVPAAAVSGGAGRRPGPEPARLRAEGVSCGAAGRAVLRELDLDLVPGSRIAVVGPSGSGKTTLLATLAGLLQPLDGRLTLEEHGRTAADLAALPDADLRSRITLIADDAHVFATTVRENLRLAAPRADDAALVEALRTVGLGPWLEHQPGGLDAVVATEPGASPGHAALSGGERRRLLLARAVLGGAGVLLLDEPAEHLDSGTADALVTSALARSEAGLGRDRTVVVVTHRLTPLAAADEVLVLGDGGVVARGSHHDLLATCPAYREAYEHEQGGADRLPGMVAT